MTLGPVVFLSNYQLTPSLFRLPLIVIPLQGFAADIAAVSPGVNGARVPCTIRDRWKASIKWRRTWRGFTLRFVPSFQRRRKTVWPLFKTPVIGPRVGKNTGSKGFAPTECTRTGPAEPCASDQEHCKNLSHLPPLWLFATVEFGGQSSRIR